MDKQPETEPAWIEIDSGRMYCPCGHKTPLGVDSVICSHAYATCAGCGKVWGTPAAVDCEAVEQTGLGAGAGIVCTSAALERIADALDPDSDDQALAVTPGETIEGIPTHPGWWCMSVGAEWFAVDVRGDGPRAIFRHPTMPVDVFVPGYAWAKVRGNPGVNELAPVPSPSR
jgi:hypothetical protein